MTNIDKVRICSLALSHIGSTPIMSINEKGPKAEACRLHYESARVEAISGAQWSFATRWQTGVLLDVDPLPPFTLAYSYPSDALRLIEISRAAGETKIPYKVSSRIGQAGKQINTDRTDAVFIYTVDIDDVSQFDMEFVIAFSWLLASKIAMPITKSQKLQAEAWKQWIALQSIANAHNMNEDVEDVEKEPFYQAVR